MGAFDTVDYLIWVAVEVWLAELGYDVPLPPTQWLIPYAEVRANWMAIAERIIGRGSTP